MQLEDPEDGFGSLLQALALSAQQANLARAAVLEDGLGAWAQGRLDDELRAAAVSAAHQVVGSAGTFGRQRASVLAASFERWFRDGHDTVGPDEIERARTDLGELWSVLRRPHQDEE